MRIFVYFGAVRMGEYYIQSGRIVYGQLGEGDLCSVTNLHKDNGRDSGTEYFNYLAGGGVQ